MISPLVVRLEDRPEGWLRLLRTGRETLSLVRAKKPRSTKARKTKEERLVGMLRTMNPELATLAGF